MPEDVQGETPANPAWELVSERIETMNPSLPINWSEDAGLGDVDWQREPLLEESELELEYALQRWFLDAAGDPNDMAAYGMTRIENLLPSSLTFLARTTYGAADNDPTTPKVKPSSTVNARYNDLAAADGSDSTAKAARSYTVMKGLDVNEGTLTGERGESAWMVELTCPAEHGRPYQIDQPPASTTITMRSTDPGDTGLQITIEDEGAVTSETVALDATDATTVVATTATFSDIDAIQVADANGNVIDGEGGRDYAGNIIVAIDTGDPAATGYSPTEGEWLSVLWGSDEYGNTYGDPGIPLLGAGSRAAPISAANETPSYYRPQNLGVERPTGQPIEHAGGVQSVELEFGNNVERSPSSSNREQTLHHGMFEPEGTVTADGETVSNYMQHEQASGIGDDTRFLFNRTGDEWLDWINAVVTETDLETSSGENAMEREFTIMPRRDTDGGRAINISPAGSGP